MVFEAGKTVLVVASTIVRLVWRRISRLVLDSRPISVRNLLIRGMANRPASGQEHNPDNQRMARGDDRHHAKRPAGAADDRRGPLDFRWSVDLRAATTGLDDRVTPERRLVAARQGFGFVGHVVVLSGCHSIANSDCVVFWFWGISMAIDPLHKDIHSGASTTGSPRDGLLAGHHSPISANGMPFEAVPKFHRFHLKSAVRLGGNQSWILHPASGTHPNGDTHSHSLPHSRTRGSSRFMMWQTNSEYSFEPKRFVVA